jgi:hypothetical protein
MQYYYFADFKYDQCHRSFDNKMNIKHSQVVYLCVAKRVDQSELVPCVKLKSHLFPINKKKT